MAATAPVENTDFEPYRNPTWFIDSDSPAVIAFAQRVAGSATSEAERAVSLYYAVRDGIRYDPYSVSEDRNLFRASVITGLQRGFCIQKAILLAAAARAAGIPSRLGFADVRNHLTSERLRTLMGSDLFIFHGYTELHLSGKWVKATPTFNKQLCRRFGVLPLDFDGMTDAIFHPFDARNRRHMEYVNDRGRFADLPYEEMIRVFREAYPNLAMTVATDGPADPQFQV